MCAERSRPASRPRTSSSEASRRGRLAHRFAVSVHPLTGADGAPAVACLIRDVSELVAWRRGLGGIEQLAADLSGAATLADVTDLIVSRSRELVGAETVAAALRTQDGAELEMVGMAGFDERTEREWSRFDLDIRTPMGDAVRSGEPVFLDEHDHRARDYPQLRLEEGETVAAVPITGRAGVLGAIAFRFRAGRRLERGDRSAMLTIGQHYGHALDRAKLFEAAESERQRLEALMNQLPVGVAIAEAPSGHIVAVNAKATEIWRAPPAGSEPITDVTPYIAFHPDGRRFSTDDWPIARSLATGEVVENEEIEVEFSDGTRGWVNISSRPVLDAGGTVLGAVTTLVDVTEPRRRETEARFIAEATDLLTESLDPEEALRRLARLVVPRLADWCAVYIREGARIRTVALEHSDPRKIELGLELNRRYPTDPDGDAGVALVMRTGMSQLTPQAHARDGRGGGARRRVHAGHLRRARAAVGADGSAARAGGSSSGRSSSCRPSPTASSTSATWPSPRTSPRTPRWPSPTRASTQSSRRSPARSSAASCRCGCRTCRTSRWCRGTTRPASTTWWAGTSTTCGRSARAASALPSATCAERAQPRPR